MRYFLIYFLLVSLVYSQAISPSMEIANIQILKEGQNAHIYQNGELKKQFNDQTFDESLSCRNGNLLIIDAVKGTSAVIAYTNMPTLSMQNIIIKASPNIEPKPYLNTVNQTHFQVIFNCSCGQGKDTSCSSQNYFNKVQVNVYDFYFSFLVNCDPNKRHKQFQIGYMFIALINAVITIGVAMHSHVWSIRIDHRPLRYVLFWKPFLIFSVVVIGIVFLFSIFTYKELWNAFTFVKYFGIVFSIFFLFLCFNQTFYLFKKLRKYTFKFVRHCDVISSCFTLTITLLAMFFDNWILYNFIAGCICVGSIKILHFNSLKESYLAMTIMVLTISTVSIMMHFMLPISYNDYAGQLSSPLFFQVPDLVNNLFKKCSWLPVLDVIIPGVTLSFLRVYDENKSSKWGGIYTVSGNLAFVISTIIWIGIEYVDPYSCPFSLVTFPLLMLTIFIVAWRRNQWNTLLNGLFQQGYDIIDMQALQEKRSSFSKLVPDSVLQDALMKDETQPSMLTN